MLRDFFRFGFLRDGGRRHTGRRRVALKAASYRPQLLDLEDRTLPSTISWLRPVGGDWDGPANWAGGRVPLSSDDAVIPFAGITVTHATNAADSVRSLHSEAALDVSAGRLTINAGNFGSSSSQIDALVMVRGGGTLSFLDGSVGGVGTLRNFATLNLGTTGTIGSAGVFNIAVDNEAGVLTASGVINNDAARPFVNGPNATLAGGTPEGQPLSLEFTHGFTNQGRIQLQSLDILAVDTGTLVNAPGATVDFLGGGSFQASPDNQGTLSVDPAGFSNGVGAISTSAGMVTNEGTITIPGSRGMLTIEGGTFEQAGNVIGPGTLELIDTTTDFGPDSVNAVAQLEVFSSTVTSAAPITNLLAVGGSTINAPVVNRGTLTVRVGFTPDFPASSTINGAVTNAAGATLTVNEADLNGSEGVDNSGSILLIDADIITGAALAELTVSGGLLTNEPGGTITVQAGGGLSLLNAALDNQGALNVGDETSLTGSLSNSGTVHVENGNGFAGRLTVALTDPTAPVTNSGTITIDSLRALVVQGGDLVNAGTVTVGSFGTLEVDGNYTQSDGLTDLNSGILAAGGLVDLEGGVLAGTGVINAEVLNNAEVDVGQPGSPGTLTIVGDYTQTSGGVLVIEIGGPNPGTDFDQLNITGQASLDGTLTVNLINGFQPESGDSFTIMTFGSASGTFATINGDGPSFTPVFNADDLILVAN
jgi:hypothetical protein